MLRYSQAFKKCMNDSYWTERWKNASPSRNSTFGREHRNNTSHQVEMMCGFTAVLYASLYRERKKALLCGFFFQKLWIRRKKEICKYLAYNLCPCCRWASCTMGGLWSQPLLETRTWRARLPVMVFWSKWRKAIGPTSSWSGATWWVAGSTPPSLVSWSFLCRWGARYVGTNALQLTSLWDCGERVRDDEGEKVYVWLIYKRRQFKRELVWLALWHARSAACLQLWTAKTFYFIIMIRINNNKQ